MNAPGKNLAAILGRMPRRQLLRVRRFLKAFSVAGFEPLWMQLDRELARRRGEKLSDDSAEDELDPVDVSAGARRAQAVADVCDGPNRQLFEALAALLAARMRAAPVGESNPQPEPAEGCNRPESGSGSTLQSRLAEWKAEIQRLDAAARTGE